MSDSHSVNFHTESSHHEENDNGVPNNNVPPVDPNRAYPHSQNNVNTDRSSVRDAHADEGNGATFQQLRNQLEMDMAQLQAQQAVIAQLQNQNRAPNVVQSEQTEKIAPREERTIAENNGNGPGQTAELMRMLEELTKWVEANDKKVKTYNSRVDQILGAPPILKGPDSEKFVQMPFPPSAAPKPISKRFRMPDIPKYNRTTDPNEHVTTYTCAIKGNDLAKDEIESVLLKKFGETLSKGAMVWYHNLPEHSIDSFAMHADAFVKAHAGAIKVETRKSNLFNVKKQENETLREFVARFQMERMDLPSVQDDWAVQAFTQRLNPRSSITSLELKQNLVEYREHNSSSRSHWRDKLAKLLQSDPERRDKSLICKFHGTHGHRTEDCRQLREEVARLFNLGYLREFPSAPAKTHFKNKDANKQVKQEEPEHVLNMVIGGVDIPRDRY
ncbi:uncharacterized protein LOC132047755 [Lycium ferocissimum]|uniref:uncharacterized protein LOC132047755 n=1 Tax=Lycium ferocissimum TaxID=112874 RepID=UPI002816187A|nr:uncharacterized protein LOC132047755 [Lycium ferocissimum]